MLYASQVGLEVFKRSPVFWIGVAVVVDSCPSDFDLPQLALASRLNHNSDLVHARRQGFAAFPTLTLILLAPFYVDVTRLPLRQTLRLLPFLTALLLSSSETTLTGLRHARGNLGLDLVTAAAGSVRGTLLLLCTAGSHLSASLRSALLQSTSLTSSIYSSPCSPCHFTSTMTAPVFVLLSLINLLILHNPVLSAFLPLASCNRF